MESATAPGHPADAETVRREVLELVLDRIAADRPDPEAAGSLGAVELGLDSVDLLAVGKVIASRWGVELDVIDMLMFSSVDEMIDEITGRVAGGGTGS
ncbi:hypothetical protein [Streptomyces zhihengii]